MTTRFTIAIPTHNRRDTVLLAARSALGQTRPPAQVLVLCDGCTGCTDGTDGTAEALGRLSSARLAAIELPKGSGYDYAHRNGVIGHPDDRLESFGSDRSLPSNRARLASSNQIR